MASNSMEEAKVHGFATFTLPTGAKYEGQPSGGILEHGVINSAGHKVESYFVSLVATVWFGFFVSLEHHLAEIGLFSVLLPG